MDIELNNHGHTSLNNWKVKAREKEGRKEERKGGEESKEGWSGWRGRGENMS